MTEKQWRTLLEARLRTHRSPWGSGAVLILSWALCALGIYFVQHSFFLGVGLTTLSFLYFYLLVHEATHFALSKHRRLNSAMGHTLSWLILLPFLPRQRSHLLHHHWTGHPKGDPANRRLIHGFAVMTSQQVSRLEFIWNSGIPLLVVNDRIGLWRDPFLQRKKGVRSARIEKEIRASYLYFVAYGVLLIFLMSTGLATAVFSAYLPALLGLFFLEELVNLPHHAETPLVDEEAPALSFWQQGLVTHSCRSVPFFSKFVLLNFNLHTAHHYYPWLPWSHLPTVQQELDRMPDVATAFVENEILWSLRNRRRSILAVMGHYFDKRPHTQVALRLEASELRRDLHEFEVAESQARVVFSQKDDRELSRKQVDL